MHAGLAYNLLDDQVLRIIRFDCDWLAISTYLGLLIGKDIKSKTLALIKRLIDHETMLRVRMREVDALLACLIDVGLVIVSIFDGLPWLDQLSDVDCLRASVLLQVISEGLQVVRQILRS